MARLQNSQGHFLELHPVRYEFSSGDNEYDLNWLLVSIKADNGHYQWSATDPAFLNWELNDLVEWLRKVSLMDTTISLDFGGFEPCLEFKLVRTPSYANLVARFSHEFLPATLRSQQKWDAEVTIVFEVSR